ncbi:MAG: ABC transporter substrate-binding protein [Gammaproteobacteria bacterium]|nr:ABC transporter substrate-binding protein [Gammaproteobacteria bacterium]
MNSRQLAFTALLGLALLAAGARADAARGIVSLDLCTDWMLLKFADPSQVRAYSPLLYRYQADWVPDGLPVHDGSIEHILQLDAGLLISGEYNAILLRKRLQQLGKQVAVLSLPNTLDGIRRYQDEFFELIDATPDTGAIDWSRTYAPRHESLLLLGANGIGTGANTLENDLLRKAGWDNYIEASGYVSLRMERIVANPPDAIYSSAPLSNSLSNLFIRHPAIQSLMAEGGAAHGEDWRWQCPGPWSLELIQELSAWKGS